MSADTADRVISAHRSIKGAGVYCVFVFSADTADITAPGNIAALNCEVHNCAVVIAEQTYTIVTRLVYREIADGMSVAAEFAHERFKLFAYRVNFRALEVNIVHKDIVFSAGIIVISNCHELFCRGDRSKFLIGRTVSCKAEIVCLFAAYCHSSSNAFKARISIFYRL